MNLKNLYKLYINLLVEEVVRSGLKLGEDEKVLLIRSLAIGTTLNVGIFLSVLMSIYSSRFIGLHSWVFALVAIASLIASPGSVLLFYRLLALERGRRIEKELKYLLISESINASASPSLIEDIASAKDVPSIFRSLSAEGRRVHALRKILNIQETARAYSRWISSSWVKAVLSEFLFALRLGTLKSWFMSRGKELIDDIKHDVKTSIQNRIMISLSIAIVLGYTPPLILAMNSLANSSLLESYMLLTLLVLPLAIPLLPKYPHHLKIFRSYRNRILLIFFAILVLIAFYFFTYSLRISLLSFSLALIVPGLHSTVETFKALKEAKELSSILDALYEASFTDVTSLEIIKEVLNRKKGIWNEVSKNFTPFLSSIPLEKLRTWISRFSIYTILKGVEYGSVNRESLSKLSELIHESLNEVKTAIASNIVLVVMAVALPYIMYTILTVTSFNFYTLLYMIISSMGYAFYVSYSLFDDITNTLLPSIVGIEISLMVM